MILTRPRLLPQERFDLEDLNALLAAGRTDAKLYTKEFLSSSNYVMKGFTFSGIGLKSATMIMANATLIIPQNTSDFSWYTASPSEPNYVITQADFTPGTRNYVEISLINENNTPLTRAFWDPEANSGAGQEFNQIVETVTDLSFQVIVSTGGFSGLPDRLPLAIMDIDGSGNIKSILDRRNLFYRLSKTNNLFNSYAWGTKQEPGYTLTMTSETGTFAAGETINIGTETATVVTGGAGAIVFNMPSGINFFPGGSVVGLTSGATGTINTVSESFAGVDKSITDFKSAIDAIMTEIKVVKGTNFWWEDPVSTLAGVKSGINSLFVQAEAGAKFEWDGSNFIIGDNLSSGQLSTDVLAYLRILGRSGDLALCRQDSYGGSVAVPIAEKQVVYIKIPTSGSRTFSGVGSGSTNFNVTNIASFIPNDANYWIAYRELNRLYIRGYGELEVGEEIIINDPMKEDIEAQIAAIVAQLDQPAYEETIEIVASGAAGNQLNYPQASGSTITLPNNSRQGGNPQSYENGKGQLEVFLNGQILIRDKANGWSETGSLGQIRTTITIAQDLQVNDFLTFRIVAVGAGGGGGGGGAADDNFVTLNASGTADNADYVLIYDVSLGGYRKQSRANFLQGLNGIRDVREINSNTTLDNTYSFINVQTTAGSIVLTLPPANTMAGKTLDIKNIGTGTMTIMGTIDGGSSLVSSVQYASFTLNCDGVQYWLT